MALTLPTDPGAALGSLASSLVSKVGGLALSPASPISLFSLLAALLIGTTFLLATRAPGKRPVPIKVLARALFPRRITHAPSTRTDLGFLLFNVFAFGLLFGWGLLSYKVVGAATHDGLTHLFGALPPTGLGSTGGSVLVTLAMVLAYELGFWLDHYSSHHIPFFWEIHRVHHTATVLTPLTLFRVHPIESLKLASILAVVMGSTYGLVGYLLGSQVSAVELFGRNIILLALMIFASHLQHTHLWIPFTGPLGRLFVSPAHHQIHHSDNPADYGKNLGGYLAIWDWAFGTLRVPPAKRPALTFGAGPFSAADHSFVSVAIKPVQAAFAQLSGARQPALQPLSYAADRQDQVT
jgi:sterol desaturase/sphingolipid hydroxylase (fatty acid hydroxylase superfamily)